MEEFNVITEFKNGFSANDLPIYIYKMRVRDFEKRHNENYKLVENLRKLNNNMTIAFYEQYIGAFEEIKNWGEEKYISVVRKEVDIESYEKNILSRLLLKGIKDNIDNEIYEVIRDGIYIKNPVYYKNGISIKRYFKLDINIELNGDIIIGFDTSHSFEYIKTLDYDIENNNIKTGDRVKDFYHNSTYEYIGLAPFTISEENEYLGCSIVDYYKNKNQYYIVSKLSKDMKAVLVKSNRGDIFPYIPSRLKKVCRFETLNQNLFGDFYSKIKQKTDEKMRFMINEIINIVKPFKYINLQKRNMVCNNIGYKVKDFKRPELLFGKSRVQQYPMPGLQNFGAYENKKVNIKYFIDPMIAKNKIKLLQIINFCNELEKFSAKLGVRLNRIRLNDKVDFNNIDIENEDKFSYELNKMVKNYDETTIVILDDRNLSKYYKVIKKTFSAMNNVPTQCISYNTLNYSQRNKNSILLNILLGIYAKSGVQPWILKEELNSDCFIGLDVSRENKVNKAGIVQVIGKNGGVLKTKVISEAQSGEKIELKTLKNIVFEAISSYEEAYNTKPRHITFHRDGISREELDNLKITMSNIGIDFDYIEITKGINRRIATISKEKKWKTIMGRCYYKNNTAFICTTEPSDKIGMAQPIRIKSVFGNLDIEKVVEDAYKLTFMHVGALNKIRLPITTYYADLSSTYGNRELIPSNVDTNYLYFV